MSTNQTKVKASTTATVSIAITLITIQMTKAPTTTNTVNTSTTNTLTMEKYGSADYRKSDDSIDDKDNVYVLSYYPNGEDSVNHNHSNYEYFRSHDKNDASSRTHYRRIATTMIGTMTATATTTTISTKRRCPRWPQ